MRRTAIIIMAAATLAAAAQAAEEPQGETWMLSGQSNACGRGKHPGLDPNPLVTVFDLQKAAWVPAKDPLPGMRTEWIGPWQAAAVGVAGRTGQLVRLVGAARGGTPAVEWNPGKSMHAALVETIRKSGSRPDVFMWYQGECEADHAKQAGEYDRILHALAAEFRKQTANPKLMMVVIQLSSKKKDDGFFKGYTPLRESQRRFVLEDGNAILLTGLGRQMGDPLHLGREGQLELGAELARAILRTRHQLKEVNWPGPVMDAAALGADGRTVTAHFAEVKQLAGVEAADFGTIDTGGKGQVVRAAAARAEAGRTVVRLSFAEPVKLPASLVYGHGVDPKASLVDEAGNRAPAVQVEIAQGPAPADQETLAPNGAGAARPAGKP